MQYGLDQYYDFHVILEAKALNTVITSLDMLCDSLSMPMCPSTYVDAAVKGQTSGTQTNVNLVTFSKGKGPEYNRGPHDTIKYSWDEDANIGVDIPWWLINPSHKPYPKMEFPRFEGGDPHDWILKAEKYFRYSQTHDNLKVDIVAMYLEGDVCDLFAWINTFDYWAQYKNITRNLLNDLLEPRIVQNTVFWEYSLLDLMKNSKKMLEFTSPE
ncbi:hypothetical protein CQW23_19266 [Capsicum baccatum]|uniref:Uncharacterized protein n=1 Tax=Capsicum baccatum TaxID=33114 RepID=A0A2G2W5A8_CAPBA|nr:hypothetical protein CQW23_19266 [Capsicum baccatum]